MISSPKFQFLKRVVSLGGQTIHGLDAELDVSRFNIGCLRDIGFKVIVNLFSITWFLLQISAGLACFIAGLVFLILGVTINTTFNIGISLFTVPAGQLAAFAWKRFR